MLAEPVRFAVGWPLVLSLAAAVAGRGLLAGRRRMALNEALHELRRPLQGLALAEPAESGGGGVELTRQAAAALERLEREINGEAVAVGSEPVAVVPLLAAAVARWSALARRAGSTLALRPGGGGPVVCGDRDELARAVDNLLVNALEHGGSRVSVGTEAIGGRLRIVVRDAGPPPRPGASARDGRARTPSGPAATLARLSGRCRRGHGLRVVRRVAAVHGGELRLRRRHGGTEAVLELPLAGSGAAPAAGERA